MEQVTTVSTGSDNSQDGEAPTLRHNPADVDQAGFDSRTHTEIAFEKAKDRRVSNLIDI